MPVESKERDEAVDHVERARDMVSAVIDGPQDPRNDGAAAYLIGAQVHASLAIAERLSDIAHELEELDVRLTR
jgi:hypothetical protein